MIVSSTTSNCDIICNSKEKIAEIIKYGATLPKGDDIWIGGEEEYPCLSILVKGAYACVHYFLNQNGDVWQSYSNFDKEVTFLAGEDEWTAPEDTIVPLEMAIKCMEEFFNSMKRPECIEWQEL